MRNNLAKALSLTISSARAIALISIGITIKSVKTDRAPDTNCTTPVGGSDGWR